METVHPHGIRYLTALVGTHVVEALWRGTRYEYSRVLELTLHQRDSESSWVTGADLQIVMIQIDGLVYRFEEEAISTPDPQDRSTMLGAICVMKDAKGHDWHHQFEAGHVMEIRLHKTPDLELLYATCERTGVCFFEIGTEFGAYMDRDEMEFRFHFEREGYEPAWLEPDDGGPPPTEIIHKTMGYTPKQVGAGGRGSKKIGSRRPLATGRLQMIRSQKKQAELQERIRQSKREFRIMFPGVNTEPEPEVDE